MGYAMRYFGSSPNRLFFLMILLAAIYTMCTNANPLMLINQRVTEASPTNGEVQSPSELPA
jgi:hypothetical protein